MQLAPVWSPVHLYEQLPNTEIEVVPLHYKCKLKKQENNTNPNKKLKINK